METKPLPLYKVQSHGRKAGCEMKCLDTELFCWQVLQGLIYIYYKLICTGNIPSRLTARGFGMEKSTEAQ